MNNFYLNDNIENLYKYHKKYGIHDTIRISNRKNSQKNNQKNNQYKNGEMRLCDLCMKSSKMVHSIFLNKGVGKGTNKKTKTIHISPGNAEDHSTYYVCQHFILSIEDLIRCDEVGDTFKITFDFENYTLKQSILNTKLAIELCRILNECYFYRLEKIELINPPFYIKPILVMIKKLFANRLYQKIKIV